MMELRSIPSLNVVIFNDRLVRPQMAMLTWLLDEGEYERLVAIFVFCVVVVWLKEKKN